MVKVSPKEKRNEQLNKAITTEFDVCIIGGGATGAGCALDAALRGLSVILIEKNDFGSATSGKSTKLIHGGVRYLEQAVKKLSLPQFLMVRKALKERRILLKIAPHLTRPLPLLTPCQSLVEGLYYFLGLKLYDWISGRRNIGSSELLSRKKAIEKIPTLSRKNLFNAVLYYDGQLDDLRYNWALIETAISKGATCINHAEVIELIKDNDNKLRKAHIKDKIGHENFIVSAKVFVNATGPFADHIRLMANQSLTKRVLVSKGVHILLPKQFMSSQLALLIPKTKDGRVIFAIPYQKHLLVGTTDDETELIETEFGPNSKEVDYLLEYLNTYLDVSANRSHITAGFGGLRPLILSAKTQKSSDLVRDHEIEYDRGSHLISVLGGKWTTYRLMAKDCIDRICSLLNLEQVCSTDSELLCGSKNFSHQTAIDLQKLTGWDHEVVKHLVRKYGDAVTKIAEIAHQNPELNTRVLPGMPYTYAELEYVLLYELAFTIKDVLARRWGTQLADWQQTQNLIKPVGIYMASRLNWTIEESKRQISDYENEIEGLKKEALTATIPF
jgi:glycerol-3-phosphate dehydrogenase